MEIVITSYDTVRRMRSELCALPWLAVICDEVAASMLHADSKVHKLRNPRSQVTMALKSLKTLRRIGLSGTADRSALPVLLRIALKTNPQGTVMQNNFGEFWCVLDWMVPGLFL